MSPDADYRTIRVPADVYEDAKARKETWDVTWGEYVDPHAWHSVFDAPDDAPPGIDAQVDSLSRCDSVDGELYEEIRKLQELVEQTPSRTVDLMEGRFR